MMEKLSVNKKLLPLKGHYFLFNAGTAPVVPFIPTYARQLGFSTVVVGTIYTILPVIGMLAKPTFGAIADRFKRQKLLFLLFLILTAAAFFMIMFIPAIPNESQVDFKCNDGANVLSFCPADGETLKTCTIDALDTNNGTLSCSLSCHVDDWMWNVVCDHWKVPIFCKEHSHEDLLQFEAVTRLKDFIPEHNCLELIVRQGHFATGESSMLNCPGQAVNATNKSIKTRCDVKCDNSDVNEIFRTVKIQDNEVTGLYQFWLFFAFLVFSWVGMAVVVSVGDAICFEMLGDRPHLYGNQRLWGAVGWGTFSIISGLLVDKFSQGQSSKDYSVVFYLMLALLTLDMFVSSKLNHTQTKVSTNIVRDVGMIFKSFRIVVFFAWCIVVGLCTALVWNFLFWHLEDLAALEEGCDHMKWIKTLEGLAMGIQCFGGELPFFFLSGWILKKIGHIHAMSLVLLGFSVRFLLYSALTNPWYVLPIELLNGVTFGVFYSTMASYASIVAPSGTEATMQGLVGAVFEGVGVSLGSLLGGVSFKHIGGSATFQYFGIGALIFFGIHVALQMTYDKFWGSSLDLTSQYRTPTDAIHMLDDQDYTHHSSPASPSPPNLTKPTRSN